MIRKLTLAAVALLALGGCVTDGYYGGYRGGGDYYYGQPSSSYYYDDGYGYYDRYGYGGYGRYGYGYGYPAYGYYGGYGYPYHPPYRPRPDHPDDDQAPNTLARPTLIDGGRAKRASRLGGSGLRSDIGSAPSMRAIEDGGRLRRPSLSAPMAAPRSTIQQPRFQQSRPPPSAAPRSDVQPPRFQQSQPSSGRSAPRPTLSRPPASRLRDSRQQVER